MKSRLRKAEVVFVDPALDASEYNVFIQKWLDEHQEEANDDTYMPIFSPYVGSLNFVQSEDNDVLHVVMNVSIDIWPSKAELAELINFAAHLESKFDSLEVLYEFKLIKPESVVSLI